MRLSEIISVEEGKNTSRVGEHLTRNNGLLNTGHRNKVSTEKHFLQPVIGYENRMSLYRLLQRTCTIIIG